MACRGYRHVVQEMHVKGDMTLWEDKNEYYELNDALTSMQIDQQTEPEKLFRVASIRYH